MHFQVDNSVVHPQKYIFWESACIFLYCKPLCTSALWNTSKFFSLQGGWRRRIVAQSTITSLQCTPHSHHRLLLRFTVYYISLAVLQCLVSVVLLAGFFMAIIVIFAKIVSNFFIWLEVLAMNKTQTEQTVSMNTIYNIWKHILESFTPIQLCMMKPPHMKDWTRKYPRQPP